MKLKKLTIDNIASIDHAVIDFDAAPLSDEHLFLITGQTGSGKSTIIDCICLALYGTTPRLKSASKDKYEASKGQKPINAANSKQLLRRGALAADVCLTFDNNEGIPYVATWHVHRADKKVDGNIIGPRRILRTAEGVNPTDYAENSEVDNRIHEIIGLDVNEFFRTVVLAQGKFAEFLASSEKDKSDLLEKMTGTKVYSQVGKKIYEVYREQENQCKLMREALQQIVLLTDDQKAQIKEDVIQFSKLRDEALKLRDGAKNMANWLDEKTKNERDLEQKNRDIAAKRDLARGQAHVERQQLVADWDATIGPRRELRECQRAEREIESLQAKQPAMQEEFDELCAGLRAATDDLTAQRGKLKSAEDFLQQEAPNSEMYKSIKGIKMLLKQRKTEQSNIVEFSKTLQRETERQPGAEAQVNDALQAVRQQEALVSELQSQYDAMGVSGINRQKDAMADAKQALSQLKNAHEAVAQAATRLSGHETDLAKEKSNREQWQSTLEDKRLIKEQAHAAVERETDWNNLLQQAHKSLHEGDTCPVCGNKIKKLLTPKGENVLDELRNQFKLAEENLNVTMANITAADKSIDRINRLIKLADKEVEEKKLACDRQWQQTSRLLQQCGIVVDRMPDSNQADALIADLVKEMASLNSRLEQASQLNDRITTERKNLASLTQAHNMAVMELSQVMTSIKTQKEAIASSTVRMQARTAELNAVLTISDWQERVERDDDFIVGLERRAIDYLDKESLVQRLRRDIGIAAAVIPAMTAHKAGITGLQDHGKTVDGVPRDLEEQWRNFKNQYSQWNNNLDNERANARRSRQLLERYMSDNPGVTVERLASLDRRQQGEIDAMRRTIQELNDSITRMQGELATLLERNKDLMAHKPVFPIENRGELDKIHIDNHDKYEELSAQVAMLNEQLRQDQINANLVGEKKDKLDKAEAQCRQWAELNDKLGSADGTKFRNIAQSYILGELLHNANGYLSQFNDRYELVAKPGTLIILVRDLLQGDLTSVATLSGGESFMVSLALALALSSATGKMFSVDTLFIDEGFGSLSEEYLGSVMETLNRLYDLGGRRVGIISHVEMLKERVATQIQVKRNPANNTVSQVNVVTT